MARTVEGATPTRFAIALSVQCVASCGGRSWVSLTISATLSAGVGAVPGGRVLSRRSPSMPSPDAGLGLDRLGHTRGCAKPVAAQKNDLRPPDMLLGAVAIRDDRFQSLTVAGRDAEADTCSHVRRLAQSQARGHP